MVGPALPCPALSEPSRTIIWLLLTACFYCRSNSEGSEDASADDKSDDGSSDGGEDGGGDDDKVGGMIAVAGRRHLIFRHEMRG